MTKSVKYQLKQGLMPILCTKFGSIPKSYKVVNARRYKTTTRSDAWINIDLT
jgi:hypothetical protein